MCVKQNILVNVAKQKIWVCVRGVCVCVCVCVFAYIVAFSVTVMISDDPIHLKRLGCDHQRPDLPPDPNSHCFLSHPPGRSFATLNRKKNISNRPIKILSHTSHLTPQHMLTHSHQKYGGKFCFVITNHHLNSKIQTLAHTRSHARRTHSFAFHNPLADAI